MFKMSDINVNVKMQISDLYMSLDINVNVKMQVSDLYMSLDINVNGIVRDYIQQNIALEDQMLMLSYKSNP